MAYLALDLGAGSGRAIVGTIRDGQIHLDEIHRFDNTPVKLGNTLYWNFLSLFDNIKEGIRLAAKKGYKLNGIAVDTWGVDFGLLDKQGVLAENPVCYRDGRTNGLSDASSAYVTKDEFYQITGLQQMDINTVFQLLSLKQSDSCTFNKADKLLFTPDLINYFLTGVAKNEYTIASTSQLLNAETKQWDDTLFDKLGLPKSLMCDIAPPSTCLGKLRSEVAVELGVEDVNVFAVGSHDTASAIGAIPEQGENWAFLSSGTWSLLGVLSDKPILSKEAMQNSFTNEGGINDKILFMRNITGLWLLQRLIDEWEKQEDKKHAYDYLLSECKKAPKFASIVNSDDSAFNHPLSMEKAIQEYCKKTNQHIPQTKGELVRCVLESLAIKYTFVLQKLQLCTNKEIKKLHIVGGGSQNELLNQYIADALGIEVVTGLTEATAIGNIIQQAIADKSLADWEAGHELIKKSFTFKSYLPKDSEHWNSFKKSVQHLFT